MVAGVVVAEGVVAGVVVAGVGDSTPYRCKAEPNASFDTPRSSARCRACSRASGSKEPSFFNRRICDINDRRNCGFSCEVGIEVGNRAILPEVFASPVAGRGFVLCRLAVVSRAEIGATFRVFVLTKILIIAVTVGDLLDLVALFA